MRPNCHSSCRPRIESATKPLLLSTLKLTLAILPIVILMAGPSTASAGHHEEGTVGKGQAAAKQAAEKATPKPLPPKKVDPLKRPDLATERAPDVFRVRFETTKGDILIEATREWSPHGADRFYNLVKLGYYDDVAFFRVIQNFMAQFGVSGDPKVMRAWQHATIPDDPVKQSNSRGMVTFAKTGRPNSRTTQLFINLVDNKRLDATKFAPFAKVIDGMDIADKIHITGEGKPRGAGPSQQRMKILGNTYLRENFPKMDYIKRAVLVE